MERSSNFDDSPTCTKCTRKMKRLMLPDMSEAPKKVSVYKCEFCETIRTVPPK